MRGFISVWLWVLMISSFIPALAQTNQPFSFSKDSTLNQLTHQLERTEQDTTQLRLLGEIVDRCRKISQLDMAALYAQKGLRIANHTTDPLLLGRFYTQIANYYQYILRYPEVIDILKQAIHYLQQTNHKKDITRAMYMLARAYGHRDMLVQKFSQIKQNLAYAEKINFHQYDVSNYMLLYTYYAGKGQNKEALTTLKTMIALAEQLNSPRDLFLAYASFGEWYDLQQQYSKGLPYHQKALAGILSQGNVDVDFVSQNYYAITNNLFQQNRLSEAQTILNEAIQLNKEAGIDTPGNLFRIQALIFERQHRLAEAFQWINKPLSKFRRANPTELVDILNILIRIQEKRGLYRDAFLLLKEQKLVNDSLQQVERHKALANLEARAELEKKTQQVALLKKNVAINQLELEQTHQRQLLVGGLAFSLLLLAVGGVRAARIARTHVKTLEQQTQQIRMQAEHLQELNSVKDKLFSVIGHDLRTPIFHLRASLKQLSQPMANQQRFDDQIAQLSRNANAIYATLDNLLHWSALQRNVLITRPAMVDLATVTQHVLMLFEPMIAQKSLEIELGAGTLWAWVDEIQAQIIVRNIVHNACKFTPIGGQISISYQTIGQESVVTITDTGIGIQTPEKPQSQKGTGLGLVVTREFLALNVGRFSITSQVGQGTTVELFFMQTDPSADTTYTSERQAIGAQLSS
ncbi:tetratricopeptide repeat-containing sensor histidine kinase [Spirosoma oryzicola]|uniref:ATP-binding protein n=1 Tax=Spirosoma oryzicola TaxID=2898794 RepID=UPI001E3BC980|nr:tetratricopeptide repeat-containing sensor histidine kinase [Spirosoma oryzicola]UHG93850.1 tetratricopeptide repeat-containing sensor histidine kinase [Spirosoma oryzicola]